MLNKFETDFISQTIEKKPFTSFFSQQFFAEWCRVHDSIIPRFLPREEWQKRTSQRLMAKNNDKTFTLFLPEDLRLHEMMEVVRMIDHDTFAEKPESKNLRADKIGEFGATCEKAGYFIQMYLDNIDNETGKTIASRIADNFLDYGRSLQGKNFGSIDSQEDAHLSEEDIRKLDEWLLGKDAYRKRVAKLGESPSNEDMEDLRKKTFARFFKALAKDGFLGQGEKPWEFIKGPVQKLHDKSEKKISETIETPETELRTSIFRRGVHNLITEMKEYGPESAVKNLFANHGIDLISGRKKLYDVLQIPELKKTLDRTRETNDLELISRQEIRIANIIQNAVCNFPYRPVGFGDSSSNNPSQMIETQYINCVGSAILGGGLLDEVGIKYLHADMPEHSATVLVTSNGKAYLFDFTPGNRILAGNGQELTADMLENKADIPCFLADSKDSGLTLKFKSFSPYAHISGPITINLSKPEIGLQSHILNNTGNILMDLQRKEEAIEAFEQAVKLTPNHANPFNGLGNSLLESGRHKAAIEAYRHAVENDPKHPHAFNGLGNALYELERYEDAIEAYLNAIKNSPRDATPHNGFGNALFSLKKYEEAIKEYEQAISLNQDLAPPYNGLGNCFVELKRNEKAIKAFESFIEKYTGNNYWIHRAKRMIESLNNP